MTNRISEVADAHCILVIGSNTPATHPITGRRIDQALRNGAKLIVVDPRETALCSKADIWLRIRPGTDVALINGMARAILEENLWDKGFVRNRCDGFDELKSALMELDPDLASDVCGVSTQQIVDAARMYATHGPATILYAMGITQHSHGTDNVKVLANLALLTGHIGKPSSGVNPLRGQNNVQGACDMGALPNVFPGYQSVEDEKTRQKFEAAWNCRLPTSPGLRLTEVFEAVRAKKVSVLYVMGENPLLTEANTRTVKKAIPHLDLFIVQDLFMTETAKLADVVLPATSFAEKDGTFTNSERRVQRVRRVLDPKAESRPDWQIICQIANEMEAEGFDFSDPQEIMEEIASVTPSYHGISYKRIERVGIQWPCPDETHPGTPYLHEDKFATANGKGQLIPVAYLPSAETTSREYPLILTTGRSTFHYHATLSRKVPGLNVLGGGACVEINPTDADELEIEDGETVRVISKRGTVRTKAKISRLTPPGVVFMTFHYHETPTNLLTNSALDPVAKIPEFKVCAVKIEREIDYRRGRPEWGRGKSRRSKHVTPWPPHFN